MSNGIEREAFEKWYSEEYDVPLDWVKECREPQHGYSDRDLCHAYRGYMQAARAQPEQRSAGIALEVGAMADILGEELRRTQAVYLTQVTLVDMIRKMLTAAPTAQAVQGGDAAGGLPPFDSSRPREEQGLYGKFIVLRVDGSDLPGGKHHGCRYFVLDVDHDKFAPAALGTYADQCESQYPELAKDLRKQFGAAPAVQGGGVPVHQFQPLSMDGGWIDCNERDLKIYQQDGHYPTRTLYTHPHNGEQGGNVLPEWEPCNPACWPETNGFRDRHCNCEAARVALGKDAPQPPKSKEGGS